MSSFCWFVLAGNRTDTIFRHKKRKRNVTAGSVAQYGCEHNLKVPERNPVACLCIQIDINKLENQVEKILKCKSSVIPSHPTHLLWHQHITILVPPKQWCAKRERGGGGTPIYVVHQLNYKTRCGKTEMCFFFSEARSSKKTKEVSAGVIVNRQRSVTQRSESRACCHTTEQGSQWCHAHTDGEEDRCEDRDSAQRVRGHHNHCGVHRSGTVNDIFTMINSDCVISFSSSVYNCPEHTSMWWTCLFQDHGISSLSEVSYSTRQSVSPVSTNWRTSLILTHLQSSVLTSALQE